MGRMGLFFLTNLAVITIASITLSLLGVGSYLDSSGTGLNLMGLLIFCAVFGFTGAFFSLFISKWMAKRSTGARIIDVPRSSDDRWLIETVQDLSRKAGIGMPEVAIFPAQESNAFATGWNRNSALVAVSEGLMSRFSKNEVRAVLAHEIGHVANGDMVTLSLIQGVVNTFVMFFARIIGHTVDRVVFKTERGHGIGYWITTIVAEIVLGILANIIVAWFSRQREFRADIAGAELADQQDMIAALTRLQAESLAMQQAHAESVMPDTIKAFGISSSFSSRFGKFFATHPPLDVRIEALKNQ